MLSTAADSARLLLAGKLFQDNAKAYRQIAIGAAAGVKTAIQDQVPEITDARQAKGLGGGEAMHFTAPFATYRTDGWSHALDSGQCLTAPEMQLQPHGVRVVGDRIEVRLTA